jgi:putative oxidoreductase
MTVLAGRLLLAALFVVSGAWHATHFEVAAAYFARLDLPYGYVVAGLTTAVELAGGLLLALGRWTRCVAWALAAFTLVATALGHRFWEADPAFFFNQLTHFLKNLAVIGGLLVLAEKRA